MRCDRQPRSSSETPRRIRLILASMVPQARSTDHSQMADRQGQPTRHRPRPIGCNEQNSVTVSIETAVFLAYGTRVTGSSGIRSRSGHQSLQSRGCYTSAVR
ncbi:hypothetical protein ABG768_015485 [Culter alburnus]|uniref:Uncharacterized protein n=1 Tax=Culter alburnus TaxID=194366 RepID=A0AAW1Z2K1_CULAL